MSESAISWTDLTWNVTRGCKHKSKGCINCYAEPEADRVNRRFRAMGRTEPYAGLVKLVGGRPRWTGEGRFVPEKLVEPMRWRKPSKIFVDSMSDLFFEQFTFPQIAAVFGIMAACQHHTFQVLTKRPERALAFFQWLRETMLGNAAWRFAMGCWHCAELALPSLKHLTWADTMAKTVHKIPWPLPNVWIGASAEDQEAADERVPLLLEIPAAVRFLSLEPLLGPINLNAKCPPFYAPHLRSDRISWVIAGCESGKEARTCMVAWLRSLRDQCAATGVPFFLKQAADVCAERDRRDGGVGGPLIKLGAGSKRKRGGVIELPYLDGVQHAAFPVPR